MTMNPYKTMVLAALLGVQFAPAVLAQAALESCRAEGFQVAVAVVDRIDAVSEKLELAG